MDDYLAARDRFIATYIYRAFRGLLPDDQVARRADQAVEDAARHWRADQDAHITAYLSALTVPTPTRAGDR